MDDILVYFGLTLTGLALGSFAGASVWRLRARQLVADKAAGEPIDKSELKRLKPIADNRLSEDRSICLDCGHQLRWYDLIPLFSWLSLGGRCRYCRQSIGWFEPLMELGVAGFFVLSYWLWPVELNSLIEIVQFGLWLGSGVGLVILMGYDAKWFLLPDVVMWPVIALAAGYAGIVVWQADDLGAQLASVAGSVLALGGLYLLLYMASRLKNGETGTWVGFGDVKLGLALGLLLADWGLALVALFMANLVGCLVILPGLLSGKLGRRDHVPFGPFLIIGFLIAAWWGEAIVSAYLSLLL